MTLFAALDIDSLFKLGNVVFMASLVAAGCALLFLLLRPRPVEKNFHIFYRQQVVGTRSLPLYEVGPGPGTKSWLDLPGTLADWELVTVTGYPTYAEAVAGARYLNESHHRDVEQVYDLQQIPTEAMMRKRFIDPHLPIPS